MTFDWQDAFALLAATAAGGYLLWRGWLVLRRKRAGCGSCGSCPSSEGTKTIVTIDLRKRS
jgi:hypothetical protein